MKEQVLLPSPAQVLHHSPQHVQFPKTTLRFEKKKDNPQNKPMNSPNKTHGSGPTMGTSPQEPSPAAHCPGQHTAHLPGSMEQCMHPLQWLLSTFEATQQCRLLLASSRTESTEYMAGGALKLEHQVQRFLPTSYCAVLARRKYIKKKGARQKQALTLTLCAHLSARAHRACLTGTTHYRPPTKAINPTTQVFHDPTSSPLSPGHLQRAPRGMTSHQTPC